MGYVDPIGKYYWNLHWHLGAFSILYVLVLQVKFGYIR